MNFLKRIKDFEGFIGLMNIEKVLFYQEKNVEFYETKHYGPLHDFVIQNLGNFYH